MNDANFFRSDDLDDLAADDAEQAAIESKIEQPSAFDQSLAFLGFDPKWMREQAPEQYLALGQAFAAGVKRSTETKPYIAAVGSRKVLRHTLYQTGVI